MGWPRSSSARSCAARGWTPPLLGLAIPFLVAGVVKSAYDLALWRLFRLVQLLPQPATPAGGTP